MSASSQIPPGPLPPEFGPVLRLPEPVPLPDAARAAFEAYGVVLPAPSGPAGQPPATSATSVVPPHLPASETVRAAAGVLEAAMNRGAVTPQELAQAEADTGILFDPQRAEDIASAAAEQAHAEDRVEIVERGRQLARMAGAQRKVDAVGRLLEGRPGFHLLPVAEIAAAAEYGTVPHDGSFPMTLAWTGRASVPDAHTTRRQVVLECVSSYGGRADLVIEGDARAALGGLLDEEARDIHAACPNDGCGSLDDYDASDPAMVGWARLEVAGIEDGPRWYCSPPCIATALARAGDDLAADDQAAAVDPDEQRGGRRYFVDDDPEDEDDPEPFHHVDDDEPHCVRCGCSARQPCAGGCHWVPNHQMADLCSRCANPAELAIAARGLE
ncbi:hypothetical protein [Streptomyces sp. NPDC048386]|uniref:hypothetical protein n=1 Tax=Streptomyces sp. NPDC048386 TaxID=3365541 RepID=UPI003718E794